MESQPRDVIFSIALMMDLPEILSFCRTSRRINSIVCDNNNFWRTKLTNDYNINTGDNPKNRYKHIVSELRKYKNPSEGLRWALYQGDNDLVKLFVDRGANINESGIIGGEMFEPLELAILYGEIDIVEYLIEKGAVINSGRLSDAVDNGKLDVVEYLVERGADIHEMNEAPLMVAVAYNRRDIIDYLIGKGANIHARDDQAIKIARINGYDDLANYILSLY